MFFLKRSKKEKKVDGIKIPTHVALFMDGNGRWAKKRGLPRTAGHREGALTLKKVVRACDEIGIKYLTVYAFSTENWNRPKKEVDDLMSLLLDYLKNAEKELAGDCVCIKVIGDENRLSAEILNEIERVTISTSKNTGKGLTLNIALNYGSRNEIIHAFKKTLEDVKQEKLTIDEIDEKVITDRLYTSGIPDPDLVIRTSGEQRLSNFLLWQSAYSEFIFTDVLWPDFDKKHLLECLTEYSNRNRRFGGV